MAPLMRSRMASSEEALPHKVLNVDASKSASRKPSEASARETLVELLSLRIIIASHIVNSLSFGVLEEFVGVSYFLEFFLGARVFLVAIGVVLLGALLESIPDLVLISISSDAEHLVGVRDLADDLGNKTQECD
jgi:hypothetical protein